MTEQKTADKSINHPALTQTADPRIEQHVPVWVKVIEVLLLVLMIAGDAVNLKQVIDIAFDATPVTAITLTAALTGAAVLMMEEAGRAAARIKAGHANFKMRRVTGLIIPWLALGLVAFAIRLRSEDVVRKVDQSLATVVENATATSGFSTDALLAALIMLVLYIASGVVAFHVGFIFYDPYTIELKRLKKELAGAELDRNNAATAHRATTAALAQVEGQIVQAAEVRDAIKDSFDGQAKSLKEHARVLISKALGDPARTSGVLGEVTR